MLVMLFIAWALMALCVAIHAGGITHVLRRLRHHPVPPLQFWSWSFVFVRIAGWVILMHLVEVMLWAVVYAGLGALPDIHTAFYFSIVTYTTTGYGDLVLPESWRLVGGIEALTGILMCGWSTGFFFAVLSNMYKSAVEEYRTARLIRTKESVAERFAMPMQGRRIPMSMLWLGAPSVVIIAAGVAGVIEPGVH